MADFVAVIRRAVDGLATNTPETRAKVYEKARGAVQRQLENMKPRPADDMLRRQMDKLQAAINEVEAEHREALAPVDEPYIAPPVAQEAVVAEAYHPAALEPAAAYVAPTPPHEDRGRYFQDEPDSGPAPAEAYYEAEREPEVQPIAPEPEPEPVAPHEDVYEEPPLEVPSARIDHAEPETVRYADIPETVAPAVAAPDARYEDEYPQPLPAPPVFYHEVEAQPEPPRAAEPAPPAEPEDDFPYPSREAPAPALTAAEPAWPPEPEWQTEIPAVEPQRPAETLAWDEPARPAHADVAAAWDDVPELVPAGPVDPIERGPSAEGIDAHFEYETHAAADAVRMPPVSELPDLDAPASANVAKDDPFANFMAAEPVVVTSEPRDGDRDPWSDLEDLIGYNNKEPSQPDGTRGALREDDIDDLMPPPTKPYRVTPVRKRNYAGIILGLIGLLLLGGGAYAVWLNRASLTDVVDGLFQSATNGEQSAQQTPPPQPASPTPQTPVPAPDQAAAPAATPAPGPTPPAGQPANAAATPATEGAATSSKFTQRLMPDGGEVDEGPGSTGGLAQNAEGQSVAQLNAPPANPAPAAPASADNAGAAGPAVGSAPTAGTPAPGAPAPAPAATPADAPAVAGEKMFLYEERIGQTAPTAIDGSVSWSLQREPGANGAPPEPVVQGRITIPGRGLTALMTFKRNNDPSLPASHLIEIVFAVPPDFEGGAIESVQRIAMKQTEQDRGSALVAVPAKITDDFHMIALNDFPDARNTNLELLRTRNWIDIPVAYRNGRRALLTLQKGPDGEKAFNDAIREWGQLGGTATGQ